MGKKARLKAIKSMASNLVAIDQVSTESHWITGAEILSWGTITEIDGKPVDPEKLYDNPMPVLLRQNNQRKIKRAYLRNGQEGVRHFLQGMLKTVEQNIQS